MDLFQNERKKYEKTYRTFRKEEMYESHDFKFMELLEEKERFLKLIRFHLKCRNEKKTERMSRVSRNRWWFVYEVLKTKGSVFLTPAFSLLTLL